MNPSEQRNAANLHELVEAAEAYRAMPPMIYAQDGHYESDEISCSCGFVSQAEDYDAARASLRRHINRKIQGNLKEREAIVERFDKALATAKEVLA